MPKNTALSSQDTSQTFRVSGKNLDVGDALKIHAEAKISESIDKYFEIGYSGHLTIEKEGNGFHAECAIHLDSGMVLQSNGQANDAYSAVDQAAERITKRLRRYKRRLKDHRATPQTQNSIPDVPYYVISTPNEENDEPISEDYSPAVIAELSRSIQKMSVSDAVQELDLTGAPVVIFQNPQDGRINVVYRRLDGHIGWIDPPASSG